MTRGWLLATGALVALRAPAWAVPVVVNNVDMPAVGFNDPTPAAPVGGNLGTTVGQQRLNVFERAGTLWGAALVGNVPIEVDARFAALPCSGGDTVLGHAKPTGFVAEVTGLPPSIWFAVPLANELAGTDLAPNEAEIEATFNGGLPACTGGKRDWYYGFDGKCGDQIDLLSVVLHELGHGLGFVSLVNLTTGEIPKNPFDPSAGRMDPFAMHLVDSDSGQVWSAMTPAQRLVAARTARKLAWDGINVGRQAASLLALGSPVIGTTPMLPGLVGHLSEADFGGHLGAAAISGALHTVADTGFNCGLPGLATGEVVFVRKTACAPIQFSHNAQQAGAVAVVFADRQDGDPPRTVETRASYRLQFPVTIPVLAVTTQDAQILAAAAQGTVVQLKADGTIRVGGDKAGRTLLFASNPIEEGSTVSHWEPLARPDLLMEPYQSADAVHDLRMELALFRDIGWSTTCGNGSLDPGEDCDQGAQNGAAAATCRADCTRSGPGTGGMAGGGVVDSGAGGQGGLAFDAGSRLPDSSVGLPRDAGSSPADARVVRDGLIPTGGIGGTSAGADGGGMAPDGAAVDGSTIRLTREQRALVGDWGCAVGGRRSVAPGPFVLGLALLLIRRKARSARA